VSLIAGLRERRERGALSEALETSRSRVAVLDDVARSMLDCVQALVLDLDELGASEVRGSLTRLRGRLHAGDAPTPLGDELEAARFAALEFAEAERDYLDRRDAELRRIIQILTDGLGAITATAAAHHRTVLDTGVRFEAASRLSDLVKVRAAITSEVATLRTAVTQRQAAEAKASAALRDEVDQLRGKVERAVHASRVDPLTQAANRAAFDDEVARRCACAAATNQGFALLLLDIDHFKAINDTYGHPVGDRVLNALVAFLRDRVRRDDMIARWGGEEFVVLMPGASLRVAFAKARTLLTQLAASEWTIDQGRSLAFTASIGVTAWREGDEPAALVERADRALYAAKHGGRNRAIKG